MSPLRRGAAWAGVSPFRPRAAWAGHAAVAAGLALLAAGHWLWAVTLRGPVLYGEGAVANAAILARDGLEYTAGARYGDAAPIFTAANYPPLYFHLAGLGDPFVAGRLLSLAAVLLVAAAIAWRARPAGALVATALALAWVGATPVMQWAVAVKPDLVALALTVGAVLALGRARPLPLLAGAFIGLAAMTKPTALLPGVALAVHVGRRDPAGAAGGLAAGLGAAVLVALATHGPDKAVRTHVLSWNALPWLPELAAPLWLVALAVLAVPIAAVFVWRAGGGPVGAYLVGGAAILALGGREGATINYALDLSAGLALALAGVATRLAASAAYPLAATAQLVVAVALLNPFGVVPGRSAGPGAWGDPARLEVVSSIPGRLLVEDAGLLVATGRQPAVDDLFLWSRNHARDISFLEGERLLQAVRERAFDAVVAETDLERLPAGPAYERQRWHPDLVDAVLERYALTGPPAAGLWVYRPR